MNTYSFITEPFRYVTKSDTALRVSYQLARTIELDSKLTDLTDADVVAEEIFEILRSPRQRFDVPVLGVDVVNLSMFDGDCPCATLVWNRFNLDEGKLVVIPDFTIDPGQGITTLRCWG